MLNISLNNVSHRYASVEVLRGITLQVGLHEIVALLGPSGCGKSTLLRLVGGLEMPSSGSVSTAPVDVGSASLKFAYVFQDPTLLPWRTAAENVRLVLEHVGISRAEMEARALEALARVYLAHAASTLPKALSGGMRQRVGLARALVGRPAALLMDEPFGGLDEANRDNLISDLVRLWHDNPFTCLYVTHSASEAVRLAHKVVLLTAQPGRIREIIAIDIPIDKRSESHPTIIAARDRIRDLIRNPE